MFAHAMEFSIDDVGNSNGRDKNYTCTLKGWGKVWVSTVWKEYKHRTSLIIPNVSAPSDLEAANKALGGIQRIEQSRQTLAIDPGPRIFSVIAYRIQDGDDFYVESISCN